MATEAAPERRAAFPEEAQALKTAACRRRRRLADAGRRRSSALSRSSTARRACPRASARCIASWRRKPTDSPIGGSPRATSITAASSTSTLSPGCASRTREIFARTHDLVFRLVRRGARPGPADRPYRRPRRPGGLCARAAGGGRSGVLRRRREDPGAGRAPAALAGRRDQRLRRAQRDRRRVRRTRGQADAFERLYRRSTGLRGRLPALLRQTKAEILETSFASELEVLVSDLKRIADADRRTRDYTVNALRRALIEIVARFPGLPQLSGRRRAGARGPCD